MKTRRIKIVDGYRIRIGCGSLVSINRDIGDRSAPAIMVVTYALCPACDESVEANDDDAEISYHCDVSLGHCCDLLPDGRA